MDGANSTVEGNAPLEDLAARLAAAEPGRLADGLLAISGDLHRLVQRLRPSADEFRAVIDFLTEVGHSANARRQEWVLLADVLGVSTLVENLNTPRPEGMTPNTVSGPFYRPDAPEVANGADLSRDGKGERLVVSGRIRDSDGAGIGAALIEVWHANGAGLYENQDPDLQPEFNLRGRLRSDGSGRFHFLTERPAGYRLPEDGPVGRLMNRLGLGLERPAHLHFRITAAGFDRLTTHVFDRADPAIRRDALFGVKPQLLAEFRPLPAEGNRRVSALDVDFVLAPAPAAAGSP